MSDRTGLSPIELINPSQDDVSRRRSLGIYYTPKGAAEILARWAIRRPEDTVLEPSFGGCAILEAALEQLTFLGCADPAKRIRGYDVDLSAFAYLRQLLGRRGEGQFALQDFLTVKPGQFAVETIIANPPFVSYHRMNNRQRKIVRSWRSQYLPQFAMTASLWAYFLAHSLSFLRINGRLAFVLPSAATSADYARPLIDALSMRFAHLSIYRVSQRLFIQAGAEERTVILLAEGFQAKTRRSQARRLEYSISSINDLSRLIPTHRPEIERSRDTFVGLEPSLIPASLLDQAMSHGRLCRVSDLAKVTIGEVIGDREFFVKTKDGWEALQVPDRYLRPIVTSTRQLNGLQILAKEIATLYSGVPRLLCPPPSRIPVRVGRYLDSYPLAARMANRTFGKRDPWYAVSYDATAAAFIGSMALESPRIILNTAGISCANGLYKLHLKPGASNRQYLAIASLTSVFRLSAEVQARVRGAGGLKLEPSDVGNLLIPMSQQSLEPSQRQALLCRLDALIRRKEIDTATREADDALLIKGGIFSARELNLVRDRLRHLRNERLATDIQK